MSPCGATGCYESKAYRLASGARSWLLRRAFALLLVPVLLCTLAYGWFHGAVRLRIATARPEVSAEFSAGDLKQSFHFDTDGDGVIVFLHMQKTGGTFFGTNLVKNLDLKRGCECEELRDADAMLKCPCLSGDGSKIWLFSRYSVGWKCGLHADWTELHECVDSKMNELERLTRERRYFYITMLREPVTRYLSEWQHVARGAHWSKATLRCGGQQPTVEDVPFCYSGERWSDVSLVDFSSCEYNLAHNRQTRMLANLTLVNCYSRLLGHPDPVRDSIMLESAKANLRSLAFFGLVEYPNETQRLFEATFGLRFKVDLAAQGRRSHYATDVLSSVSEEQLSLVHRRTLLDQQLYAYAKTLFLARVTELGDPSQGGQT